MANPFDVATRLAEGQSAVDDVQDYVTACQRLGYQHPDLTARGTQVREWYASEDGMDLQALDADCSVLSAMAAAAEDAARTQAGLVAALGGAWSGRGAVAAREFTWGSSQAANTVSDGIHLAANAAATLRDALWRAVDAKVAAVEAIDGRHQAQRAEWLAAATTVTSGTGDLATASELVDQQVKPFVHDDIGSDWLAAMRTAASAISSAYDAALARITAAPRAVFDVPGDLGPRAEPPEPKTTEGTGAAPSAVHTVPAAAVGSAPTSAAPAAPAVMSAPPTQPTAPWTATAPAALPPTADPAMQAATPMPAAESPMPSLGGAGAGTSSLGTGLSGLGQQLADLIGGLLGSADGGPPDGADVTQPEDGGPDDPDGSDDGLDDPAADDPPVDGPAADDDPAVGGGGETEAAVPGEPAVTELPAPPPEPPPAPTPPPQSDSLPMPPAVPEAAVEATGPTPCEIAADELPQVGE